VKLDDLEVSMEEREGGGGSIPSLPHYSPPKQAFV